MDPSKSAVIKSMNFGMDSDSAATSLKASLVGLMPEICNLEQFKEARWLLEEKLGGVMALHDELTYAGFIDPNTNELTRYEKPANVFALMASGSMMQPGMNKEQAHLGSFADKYMICANRPENDQHWKSSDPRFFQKASMAKRHRFLTTKNLHWQWFNALVFGLVPEDDGGVSKLEAVAEVEQLKAAALHYAKSAGGWSENIGLFVNIFGHNDVNSLFIHIVDMEETGPSFKANSFKNLPLDVVITCLVGDAPKPRKAVVGRLRRQRTRRRTTVKNGKTDVFFLAGTKGATSLKEELTARVPLLKDAVGFRSIRNLLQEELGGIEALKDELINANFLDDATDTLTTNQFPFNVFAQIAAGKLVQPGMDKEQAYLGEYKKVFMVCCNLPANDSHWDSIEPQWIGRASMGKRHRFLTVRDLHWRWFNALVFGLVPPPGGDPITELASAVNKLKALKEAALLYTKNEGGWSDRVGLFFHVFGHNSANSLHLHIVDMNCLGPTYRKHEHKNCPLDAVLSVLLQEMAGQFRVKRLDGKNPENGLALHAAHSIDDCMEEDFINKASALRASTQSNIGEPKTVSLLPAEAEVKQPAWELELITINVSGELVMVPRSTLLVAPLNSLLHQTFRHPSHLQQVDSQGNTFLNYPVDAFKLIVDRLRVLQVTDSDVCVPVQGLPHELESDTTFLASYLGLDNFFDKPQWGRRSGQKGDLVSKLLRVFRCCRRA